MKNAYEIYAKELEGIREAGAHSPQLPRLFVHFFDEKR